MIPVQILKEEGIVIIEPSGPLGKSDILEMTKEIDTYLEEKDILKGILIHVRTFPGWEDLAGFAQHVKFVREHHKKIQRVAIVADSKFLAIAPSLSNHFVAAEIKHFEYDKIEEAKQWIQEAV